MTVDHRAARPDDEQGIMDTWSASLRAPLPWLRRDWEADPRRHEHTFVAVDESGILAVVVYMPRMLRDVSGVPVRVGGIGAVATRPDARRRGHARRLLELALETMHQEGCRWSLLFTGSPGAYAPLGWRPFPLRCKVGRPLPGTTTGVRAVPITAMSELAPIYQEFNATRPLSAERSEVHWSHGVGRRLGPPVELLAFKDEGYVAIITDTGAFEVSEFATRTERAGEQLLSAVAARALQQGVAEVILRLPADQALCGSFADLRDHDLGYAMARPVAGTLKDLAVADHPAAVFWPADAF